MLDRGVVRVRSDRLEEVGAQLEEAREFVVGVEGGEGDGGGTGGDEAEVGAEETFVGELGEEDAGVRVDLRARRPPSGLEREDNGARNLLPR